MATLNNKGVIPFVTVSWAQTVSSLSSSPWWKTQLQQDSPGTFIWNAPVPGFWLTAEAFLGTEPGAGELGWRTQGIAEMHF